MALHGGGSLCTGRYSVAFVPLPPTCHSAPHFPAHPVLQQPRVSRHCQLPRVRSTVWTHLWPSVPGSRMLCHPAPAEVSPKQQRERPLGRDAMKNWGTTPGLLLPLVQNEAHMLRSTRGCLPPPRSLADSSGFLLSCSKDNLAAQTHTDRKWPYSPGQSGSLRVPRSVWHQVVLPSCGPALAPSSRPSMHLALGGPRPAHRASLVSAPAKSTGLCSQTQRPEPCFGHCAQAEGPGPPRLSRGVYSCGREEGSLAQPCVNMPTSH